MRLAYLLSLPLVLGSLHCASQSSSSSMGRMSPGTVTGYVVTAGAVQPPRGSTLTVMLVDATMSGKERTLATETRKIDNGPPYAFKLTSGSIDAGRLYEVKATISGKKQHWSHTTAYPVLTGGAPNYVEITLLPQ